MNLRMRARMFTVSGVMLFQMLCGEVPFKGSSIPSIMKKHLTSDVPSFKSKGVRRSATRSNRWCGMRSRRGFAIALNRPMILPKSCVRRCRMASAHLKRTGDSSASIDPSKTICWAIAGQPDRTAGRNYRV